MKDWVSNDIGAAEPLQDWADIDWKPVKKRVRNLRQRIYRATQKKQWNKLRSLMKLMLRSYSNLLLSVRRTTQENQGKQTAGIDGQTALIPVERVKLVREMKGYNLWQVRPTKRVYIPKANGKQRPLGIPTIKDRVAQAIVKNALEPGWEALFEANSYGFRPGRGCHDAIEQAWIRLKKGNDSWALDADIKGAFDNISHDYLLKTIGNIPCRELIKQWLKAGYIEAEIFQETESGTPQGGIISPLLANIALDGIEDLLAQFKKVKVYQQPNKRGTIVSKRVKLNKYGFVRYADDFIITAEAKEDIEAIVPTLKIWLAQRGLELNSEKTNITHIEQGFNFLGFNIRQYKGSCLVKPQKEKTLAFLQRIRKWLKANLSTKPEVVIKYINPLLRGWGNYYRHGVSKEVFSYVDYKVWHYLRNWALRRHPKKGKKWVEKKYFKTLQGVKEFACTIKDRQGKAKIVAVIRTARLPIERHIKVRGTASPDDPELKEYWKNRQSKYGKTYWAKGSKYYHVANNQTWTCPVCREHLFNGEELHTHHKIRVKDGGTERIENLIHLHVACHRHIHSGRKAGKQEA